eukprot:scaffold2654_cov126-Cylindrotheca_fusiformis.AAC.12
MEETQGGAAPYPTLEGEHEPEDVGNDPTCERALYASSNKARTTQAELSDFASSFPDPKTSRSDNIRTSAHGLSHSDDEPSSSFRIDGGNDNYLPLALRAISRSLLADDMKGEAAVIVSENPLSPHISMESQTDLESSQSCISEPVRSPSKNMKSSRVQEDQVLRRALSDTSEIVFGDDKVSGGIEEHPEVSESKRREMDIDDLSYEIKSLSMSFSADETLPRPPVDKTVSFQPGPIGLQLEPVRDDPQFACKVIRFVDGGPMNPGQARMSGIIMPGDAIFRAEANGIVGTTYEEIMQILTDSWSTRTLLFRSMWDSSVLATAAKTSRRPKEARVESSENTSAGIPLYEENLVDDRIESLLSRQNAKLGDIDSSKDISISGVRGASKDTGALLTQLKDTSRWRFWGIPYPKGKTARAEGSLPNSEPTVNPNNVSCPVEQTRHLLPDNSEETKDSLSLQHSTREQALELERTAPCPIPTEPDLDGLRDSMDERGCLFWSPLNNTQTKFDALINLFGCKEAQVPSPQRCASWQLAESYYLLFDEKELSINLTIEKPMNEQESYQGVASELKCDSMRAVMDLRKPTASVESITRKELHEIMENGNFIGRIYFSSMQVRDERQLPCFHTILLGKENYSMTHLMSDFLSFDEREKQLHYRGNPVAKSTTTKLYVSQVCQEKDFEGAVCLSSVRSAENGPQFTHPPTGGDNRYFLSQLSYDHQGTKLVHSLAVERKQDAKLRLQNTGVRDGDLSSVEACPVEAVFDGASMERWLLEIPAKGSLLEQGDFDGKVHLSSVQVESARPSQRVHATVLTIFDQPNSTCNIALDERGGLLLYSQENSVATTITTWHLRQVEEGKVFNGKVCLATATSICEASQQRFPFLVPKAVDNHHSSNQLCFDPLENNLNAVFKPHQLDTQHVGFDTTGREREETAKPDKSLGTGKEDEMGRSSQLQQVPVGSTMIQPNNRGRDMAESTGQFENNVQSQMEESASQTHVHDSTQDRRTTNRLEKVIMFTPGPVGLQLEAIFNHPEFACRVVRFVDGGPKNPGQARKSGLVNPGDYVIRAEANGDVGAGSYEEIMRVLKHSFALRRLVIRSAWEESYLDSDSTPVPNSPAAEHQSAKFDSVRHPSLPATQLIQSQEPVSVDRQANPVHQEKNESAPSNDINSKSVSKEVITAVPKPCKKTVPSFEKLQKKYMSIEKLRPSPQKHVVKSQEPVQETNSRLPKDWVNHGPPLTKKSGLSKEAELAEERRYQEEASRLFVEAESRRRAIQIEEDQNSSWDFENVVLGTIALAATGTVGVASLTANAFSTAVSGCLKTKHHVDDGDDDEEFDCKKDK